MIDMTLQIAERAARAAIAKAQALGKSMTVSVVDEAGRLVLCMKGDGTGFLTTETSRAKAVAAAAFRGATMDFVAMAKTNPFWSALPALTRAAIYGPGLIIALVLVVLPYWLWSKNDPINQVTIPHASRDSFIKNTAAGLVFWLVPYGLSLLVLPYVLYKGLTTRAWPMALSWALLFFLGTGGTTPYPKMLLGGSFDVLTLDRFTFWATITQLPLLGEFVVSLRHGRLARYTREQFGDITWRLVQISLVVAYLLISIFVANLTKFRKFQPDPINTQPIATFLEKDEHWRWRYLTLGFGDQMAWLSAQTSASSVDGNYHSARRLPEMTSTPVERLEGAKYSGVPGIGSLQQFLAVPEKYNLKFIFSNDQFYDPLLFFSGWHRLQRLENGIMVWEREDIPPMPEAPPRKEIPYYQRVMWGVVPMSAITAALIAFAAPVWWPYLRWLFSRSRDERPKTKPRWAIGRRLLQRSGLPGLWFFVLRLAPALNRRLLAWSALPAGDDSPQVRWQWSSIVAYVIVQSTERPSVRRCSCGSIRVTEPPIVAAQRRLEALRIERIRVTMATLLASPLLWTLLLIVALLVLWQISALYLVKSPTWPPVTDVLWAWWENTIDGTIVGHLGATLWRQSGSASGGASSDVETDWLRMSLDHASGQTSGVVLKGKFAGRRLSELDLDELIELLGEVRVADPQAALLLEAYLRRAHPDAEERMSGGEGASSSSAASSRGAMDRAEALEILGLDDGADEDAIRDAHRRLMQQVHPDKGGSDYLAAKINQARDVLMKR